MINLVAALTKKANGVGGHLNYFFLICKTTNNVIP